MNKVIREYEHAFAGGRQIFDAVLIANKVVDELMYRKKEGVLCKLDMENAYDYVNWGFVAYMLMRIDFGEKQRCLVGSCIITMSFSIIVNSGPWFFVQASRGLR